MTTTRDVEELLVGRYPDGQYVRIWEAPQANCGGRRCDLIAIGVWQSTRNQIIGHEIKVSRSDWMKELQDPSKSEAFSRQCHRWYIVAANGIVKLEELRAEWGLIEVAKGGKSLKIRRQASVNKSPDPIGANQMASWMRRISEGVIDPERRRIRREAAEQAAKQAERQRGYDTDHRERKLARLEEAVSKFEKESGLRIHEWNAGDVGSAVNAVLHNGLANIDRRFASIVDSVNTLGEQLANYHTAQTGVPVVKTKSCLSWYGSDSENAPALATRLDHCNHVTLLTCAGMGISRYLAADAIVANDLHADAMNFYRVLSGRHGEQEKARLIEMCKLTLSHPDEIEAAKEILHGDYHVTDRAWAFWVMCWVPRKGAGGTKRQYDAKVTSARFSAVGGNNASRIQASAGDLTAWAQIFKKVEWLQEDFRKVIKKCRKKDHRKNGIYIDPGWVGAGDRYCHRFTDVDHKDVESHLRPFEKTTVLIRYGDHPMIRELYSDTARWQITEAKARNQGNEDVQELWIENVRKSE